MDGKEDDGCVRVMFSSGQESTVYKIAIDCDIAGKGYEYQLVAGDEVYIKRGGADPQPLAEHMVSDPVFVYYADGAFSYYAHLVLVGNNIGLFPREEIIAHDWKGVDIRKESMGYRGEKDSIQANFFEFIEDDYDVIINDDGSGEAADLVALKVLDDEILLTLVHCKFSSKDEPGARLKDLYEVCGQAQRCVRWKHLNLNYLYHHIRYRQVSWRQRGYSRFLKGEISDLASIRNRSRTTPMKLQVIIVQPGLRLGKINDELLKLLGCASVYIKKTAMAELVVYGSA